MTSAGVAELEAVLPFNTTLRSIELWQTPANPADVHRLYQAVMAPRPTLKQKLV